MSLTKTKKKWCGLFSQTGGEICSISNFLKRSPDLVITDNPDSQTYDSRVSELHNVQYHEYKSLDRVSKINYYRTLLQGYDIITLHGWLNIVPADICKEYEIYNGHPGLINVYPELRGKDPQVRTWDNISNYPMIGSVIHRVTEEVDGGEILVFSETPSCDCKSVDDVFNALKTTSHVSWTRFLQTLL
jgi:folate-dependent phosphoribosylglycinamide formyltransferase PurN